MLATSFLYYKRHTTNLKPTPVWVFHLNKTIEAIHRSPFYLFSSQTEREREGEIVVVLHWGRDHRLPHLLRLHHHQHAGPNGLDRFVFCDLINFITFSTINQYCRYVWKVFTRRDFSGKDMHVNEKYLSRSNAKTECILQKEATCYYGSSAYHSMRR